MRLLHIIMPVKDSIETAKLAVEKICQYRGNAKFCVYNDFSTDENTKILQKLANDLDFELINWQEKTTTPSPNYRLTLIHAQERALAENADLVIVESDVFINENTLTSLQAVATQENIGMVANVTTDDDGNINFPYLFARKMKGEQVVTKKRFSFCCTLLTNNFLQAFSFQTLDTSKNWYDVTISHKSNELGFQNILLLKSSVVHRPHSSRPWKQLKYINPLKYYWLKLINRRDKI